MIAGYQKIDKTKHHIKKYNHLPQDNIMEENIEDEGNGTDYSKRKY
jgi:hypothetical protein